MQVTLFWHQCLKYRLGTWCIFTCSHWLQQLKCEIYCQYWTHFLKLYMVYERRVQTIAYAILTIFSIQWLLVNTEYSTFSLILGYSFEYVTSLILTSTCFDKYIWANLAYWPLTLRYDKVSKPIEFDNS